MGLLRCGPPIIDRGFSRDAKRSPFPQAMSTAVPAIAALRPILAWQAPVGAPPTATVGELLRMIVAAGPQGELQARNEQGLLLNVPPGAAAAGDVLLLRVLATQPKLELQMLERRSADAAGANVPAAAGQEDTAALRPDQAWLQQRFNGARQMSGSALPASLAAQWRGRVLAEVLRSNLPEQPGPQAAAAPAEGAARLEPFHLQGWNGQALLLRLLSPQMAGWPSLEREDEALQQQPPHRHAESEQHAGSDEPGEGLRLGLILSLNGDWVQVVMQWQQGLLLHFSADKPETLQALRALMPRIAAALAAVPLPLRHCQLSSKPPAAPPLPQGQQSQGLAHTSSGALFRAGAEIASVLQQG